MNSAKAVSVLIGVYNAEMSLDKTFRSLQDQTSQDFTIVAVNDASTDQSAGKLAAWQDRFGADRFQIITNPSNLGLTKSLNNGLAAVSTPYTARIDADDWWQSDKLAKQLDFFTTHPDHVLVGTNYINIGNGQEYPIRLYPDDATIRAHFIQRNPFAHSCVMFKTAVVKNVGGYDPLVRYGQDYDLWFRLWPEGKYANLPEFLCYRTIGQGISVDKQKEQMTQTLKTQRKYIAKYHLSLLSYIYLFEPLMLVILPNWLKNLKRKLVG